MPGSQNDIPVVKAVCCTRPFICCKYTKNFKKALKKK